MISLFRTTTIIATFFVFMISISPVSSITQAQAQQQQTQQGKFFMILKLRNPKPSMFVNTTEYEIANLTVSPKKLPGSEGNNAKVEYNLENRTADISGDAIRWGIPYKIIDTSTPDIIRTKDGIFAITTVGFTKELNTKTHLVTYTGGNVLRGTLGSIIPIPANNLDVKAVMFPNETGIIETTEK